jgi:hypothetical protein
MRIGEVWREHAKPAVARVEAVSAGVKPLAG